MRSNPDKYRENPNAYSHPHRLVYYFCFQPRLSSAHHRTSYCVHIQCCDRISKLEYRRASSSTYTHRSEKSSRRIIEHGHGPAGTDHDQPVCGGSWMRSGTSYSAPASRTLAIRDCAQYILPGIRNTILSINTIWTDNDALQYARHTTKLPRHLVSVQ